MKYKSQHLINLVFIEKFSNSKRGYFVLVSGLGHIINKLSYDDVFCVLNLNHGLMI